MASDNTEVLISLAELKGTLTSFIGTMERHGTDLRKVESDLTTEAETRRAETGDLDRRVTTIEATRKATPGALAIIGGLAGLVAVLGLVLTIADRLYG